MEIDTTFIIKEKDRHGNIRVYYRKKPGRRIRIKAPEGSPEFLRAFVLASQGKKADGEPVAPAAPQLSKPAPGTLRDLIVRYYAAPEYYRALDPRTQHTRKLILDKLCLAGGVDGKKPYGKRDFTGIKARHIRAIRDENADRPEAANGILKSLRQVFGWAIEAGIPGVELNPAREVKNLRSTGDGYLSWTIDDVEKFEKHFAIGTMPRLALALLLYTGQRRSDIVLFGPGHVKDEWIVFTQFKNRNRNPVTLAIPILPALREVIEATEPKGETFILSKYGTPFKAESFGNWFRDRCVDAGVPGRAHGLRKAAASRLAELGCSDREIMAITGHTTSKEVDRYTKGARQRVLAASAMEKMGGGRHLKAV